MVLVLRACFYSANGHAGLRGVNFFLSEAVQPAESPIGVHVQAPRTWISASGRSPHGRGFVFGALLHGL